MAAKVSPVTGITDYPGGDWRITSGYATDEYFNMFGDWHTGHDLAKFNCEGQPVFAVMDGTVKWAENAGDNGFGNLVVIQHSAKLYTRYAHLARIDVSKGDAVSAGMVIGAVGKTGHVTGAHLHFDIQRINNALDWPGKDKQRVLQNYIDPATWFVPETTVTVETLETQWLYVIAPAGLNVRNKPALSGKVFTKLPYGVAVQVKPARMSASGYQWRELLSGGWIAEAYTQTTPPDSVPANNAPPIPVVAPPLPQPVVTPPPPAIKIGLRGVHTSAGGWAPDNDEIDLVRHNGVETALIAAYEPNQAGIAIQRLRDVGVKDFIIRAATSIPTSSNPDEFVNHTLPRVKEYANAIGGGSLLVALHNEPNAAVEGWGKAWQNGVEYSAWFLKVAHAYRESLPGVKIGFPALSPGGDFPGVREDEWRFAAEAAQAINASDWIGVHAYFVVDGSDLDTKPELWRKLAQGRSIIITEGGPADGIVNDGVKLRNVYAKCAALGIPVMAWLLSGAGAWQSAGWKERGVRI